jgi:hypothetical protein
MPHLLDFIKSNGAMLSNNHTPLIAHTATDSLTNYTGLYGDRHGMPISNSYQAYSTNPAGATDAAGSFAYWTDPISDFSSTPTPGHDTNPGMDDYPGCAVHVPPEGQDRCLRRAEHQRHWLARHPERQYDSLQAS